MDQVLALEDRGDEYNTKPFEMDVVIVHAILRRTTVSPTPEFYQQGGLPEFVLVVSDSDYARIAASLPMREVHRIRVQCPAVEAVPGRVQALKAALPKSSQMYLTDRVKLDSEMRQMFSVMRFAGFFISAAVPAGVCKCHLLTDPSAVRK